MDYILLIIGFVLLIKGADFFVDGSSSLAKLLKIPAVIIGLTIVAMGTSAPEAAVSITAGMQGSNGIAISNVVGSNIFNSLVVVGVCGAMAAFKTSKDILKRDLPINILITIALIVMFIDGTLSRFDGILLLIGMVAFISLMVKAALTSRDEGEEIETSYSTIGGYCQELLDRFAKKGDVITFSHYKLSVLEADEFTIETLKVEDLSFDDEDDD